MLVRRTWPSLCFLMIRENHRLSFYHEVLPVEIAGPLLRAGRGRGGQGRLNVFVVPVSHYSHQNRRMGTSGFSYSSWKLLAPRFELVSNISLAGLQDSRCRRPGCWC